MPKPTPFETDADFEDAMDKALKTEIQHTQKVRADARTETPRKRVARAEKIAKILDTREYTGGSSSYYEIDILHPNKKRRPYMAECLDIIEALGMSFAEGECFKAIWRKCAARQGKSKRGYDDAKYDAEKIAFYGQRILDDVLTPKGNKS